MIILYFTIDLGKLSLIQINGVQNRSMLEDNKTLGVSYAIHTLLKQGPFFHSFLQHMRSFIL